MTGGPLLAALVGALQDQGFSEPAAIRKALATLQRWAAGGGDVQPGTRWAAKAELAQLHGETVPAPHVAPSVSSGGRREERCVR